MSKIIPARVVGVQRKPGAAPEIHFAVPGLANTVSLPNIVNEAVERQATAETRAGAALASAKKAEADSLRRATARRDSYEAERVAEETKRKAREKRLAPLRAAYDEAERAMRQAYAEYREADDAYRAAYARRYESDEIEKLAKDIEAHSGLIITAAGGYRENPQHTLALSRYGALVSEADAGLKMAEGARDLASEKARKLEAQSNEAYAAYRAAQR